MQSRIFYIIGSSLSFFPGTFVVDYLHLDSGNLCHIMLFSPFYTAFQNCRKKYSRNIQYHLKSVICKMNIRVCTVCSVSDRRQCGIPDGQQFRNNAFCRSKPEILRIAISVANKYIRPVFGFYPVNYIVLELRLHKHFINS